LQFQDKIQEQINVIADVKKFINETENMKKYIYSKNIIYDVINHFWSDVSFLNSQTKEKDVYKDYKNYFLWNLELFLELKQGESNKFKYNCFICNKKIKATTKPKFEKKENPFGSYDINWINNTGVDTSRKPHFWNFNNDVQICPICNLVYSCIPAGFTFLNRKGIFINDNSNAETLIKINSISLSDGNLKNIEDLENKSYFKIIDEMEQANVNQTKREIENIQVVKLDSNNNQRPYTFNGFG
jgi:CRISPR-associated protein Cst1